MKDNLNLADVLDMTEITIVVLFVFMGHCFLQHAGSVWSSYPILRYDLYIIRKGYDVQDAVLLVIDCNLRKKGDGRPRSRTSQPGDEKRISLTKKTKTATER